MAKDPDERFISARALMGAAADALRAAATPARFVREAPAAFAPEPAPPAPETPAPKGATVVAGSTPVPAPPAALAPRTLPPPPAPSTAPDSVVAPRSRETVFADRPPESARKRSFPPAVIPVAVVVVAALAFVVGKSLTGDDAPPAARSIAAGATELTVPATTRAAAVPPGLGLEQAKAYALDGATLIAGSGKPAGANLLPAGALAAGAAGRTPQVVRLGDANALRFDGISVKNRPATVLAVATREGTQVLACEPQSAAACGQALASARLTAKALDVAPSAAYQAALNQALSTYEKARAVADAQLKKAKTARAQAQAARKLEQAAGGLGTAAAKLADHPAADGLRDRLAGGARTVQSAADALAAAAARNNRTAYASAKAKLAGADHDLGKDVQALSALRFAN